MLNTYLPVLYLSRQPQMLRKNATYVGFVPYLQSPSLKFWRSWYVDLHKAQEPKTAKNFGHYRMVTCREYHKNFAYSKPDDEQARGMKDSLPTRDKLHVVRWPLQRCFATAQQVMLPFQCMLMLIALICSDMPSSKGGRDQEEGQKCATSAFRSERSTRAKLSQSELTSNR